MDKANAGNRPGDSLVVVCSYNRFDLLPHKPRGTEAGDGTLVVFTLNQETGQLCKLREVAGLTNPAFMRYHRPTGMVFVCTETIKEHGEVAGLALSDGGELEPKSKQSAKGFSTCYLTFNKANDKILVTNYWDSVLSAMPMSKSGELSEVHEFFKPPTKQVASNIEEHLSNRQSEPHHHALVLDPAHEHVAFVPDLGEDCIKQFVYDDSTGSLTPAGRVISSEKPPANGAGPRYIEFHPSLPVAYLVNELSSSLSVYKFDADKARDLDPNNPQPVLELVQETPTIPSDFEGTNTCGRVACHPSGRFVLTSNRGHDSVSVHRVDPSTGLLTPVGVYSTFGKTPRHFQLDNTGRFVLAANQDTNNVCVLEMDRESGALTYRSEAPVPSPNFVLATDLGNYNPPQPSA